jgi:NTP pyrophosphatase (non-canonical NTP hydrolase)
VNIYQKAVTKFGAEHQKMMAIEEMAELMQAISKHNRNPNEKTRLNILEELVDVRIMSCQLLHIYNFSADDERLMFGLKLEKLDKLIED